MSLDGFCDHTEMRSNDELHQHFMEDAWPAILKNPTGKTPLGEFAVSIDGISKIAFSYNAPIFQH